jgi:hypothetical protein
MRIAQVQGTWLSPIRWGAASSLYLKTPERLNCVQNVIKIRNQVLMRNKVAAFIIVGGHDDIAGQTLGFFAELGFIFPQFPYIARSRGRSREDMERNVEIVRASKELADGAAMLTKRRLDLAGHLNRHRSNAAAARRTPSRLKGQRRNKSRPAGQSKTRPACGAWARHLVGKSRVAWPRNGDHTRTILAKQHQSFSFGRRAPEMHQRETAVAAKNFAKAPGINRRAAKSPP